MDLKWKQSLLGVAYYTLYGCENENAPERGQQTAQLTVKMNSPTQGNESLKNKLW